MLHYNYGANIPRGIIYGEEIIDLYGEMREIVACRAGTRGVHRHS